MVTNLIGLKIGMLGQIRCRVSPLAGSDQNRSSADRPAALNIGVFITNDVRTFEIEPQRQRRRFGHASLWFAAIAVARVFRNITVPEMRAIPDIVRFGPGIFHKMPKVKIYLLHDRSREKPARHAGLNTLACQLYRGPFMAGQIDDENAIGFGVASFVEGNLDDALAAFDRAAAVNPDYSALAREYAMRTRFRLALRLARTSPSAAISAVKKALDLPDGSPAVRSVLAALGTVLAQKGALPPSDMAKFGDIDVEMVDSAKIAARE